MSDMDEIVSNLQFGRESLLKTVEGLSQRELTQLPVYDGWTVKDILAHIIGWDERARQNLHLLRQNQGDDIPALNPQTHNQESVAAWQDKSYAAVLAAVNTGHQQFLEDVSQLSLVDLDTRRTRHEHTVTIRSYVINMVIEHDQLHANDISTWRKQLDQNINPQAIIEHLHQQRTAFMTAVESLEEAQMTKKGTVGVWSIKDVIGHIADWERIMLQTAEHIYDPSLPPAMLHGNSIEEQNKMMAAQRDMKMNPPAAEVRYLKWNQANWDEFIEKLLPDDWRLRGGYAWDGDRGTLAEIVISIADHYEQHLADVSQ